MIIGSVKVSVNKAIIKRRSKGLNINSKEKHRKHTRETTKKILKNQEIKR